MSNKTDSKVSINLKVLHIIPSVAPSRGGPSKAVIEMVTALRELGIDAEIATTNDDADNLLEVPLSTLIDYKTVPIRFFGRLSKPVAVREFAYSGTFKHWLNKNIERYDIIHVHAVFSFVSTYAMWLARKHNKAYVVRPIGQLEDWSLAQSHTKKKYYLKLIEQDNLENANAVHFTANSEREQVLKRFPLLKAVTIPLGINKSATLTNQKSPPNWTLKQNIASILYLSRLHPKKGLELLLKALSDIKDNDFQLIIAGSGDADYEHSLKQLLTKLGLNNKCNFIGFIEGEEKQRLLDASDIFALTSYSENFGIAVLEAMAAGAMPFISKEVALSEIVAENQLGVVCDLTVDDIREQMITQLNNIEYCQYLGAKAKNYVEQHYQWPVIAKQLEKLYLNCLVST